MKLGFRYTRSIILLILGILSLSLQGNINGLSPYFGIAVITSAAMTLIYMFLHFDEHMAREIIIELLVDGFSGLIIFTYPHSSDSHFFTIVFSFWIFIMGTLLLTAGLLNKQNKDFLWSYILLGIFFIVAGFSIMHVTDETSGILNYYMGFVLVIYSVAHLWLLAKRKQEIY